MTAAVLAVCSSSGFVKYRQIWETFCECLIHHIFSQLMWCVW